MKKVARVAKAVLMRNVETKRYVVANDTVGFGTTPVGLAPYLAEFKNVFSGLNTSLGDLNNQLEGNQFTNAKIAYKFNCVVDWGQVGVATGGYADPVYFNIWLVASQQALVQLGGAFTPMGSVTAQTIFQQDNPAKATLEGQDLTIIKRKRIIIRPPAIFVGGTTAPNLVGQVSSRAYTMKASFKGMKEFQLQSTTTNDPGDTPTLQQFLKGYNYYVIAQVGYSVHNPTASGVAFGAGMYVDSYLYFKDP